MAVATASLSQDNGNKSPTGGIPRIFSFLGIVKKKGIFKKFILGKISRYVLP